MPGESSNGALPLQPWSKESAVGRLQHQSVFAMVLMFLTASSVLAETPDEKDKTVTIPLSSIVTTSPQKGMLHVRELLDQQTPDQIAKSAHGYLTQILQANKGGASSVFLVDAGDAPSAIAASFNVFVGPWTANTPVHENSPDPNRGIHWLVAYLGWGDDDSTTWEIDEVRSEGNIMTLKYHKNRLPEDSDQDRQYFFWVPLGQLSPGSYEVNIEDRDSNTTTLMRRVEISR
jgi:hypothetical protein